MYVVVVAADTQPTRALMKTPMRTTVTELRHHSRFRHGREGGSTFMKKRVELDAQGQPFGAMKAVLCADIKKYAKGLDPTTG